MTDEELGILPLTAQEKAIVMTYTPIMVKFELITMCTFLENRYSTLPNTEEARAYIWEQFKQYATVYIFMVCDVSMRYEEGRWKIVWQEKAAQSAPVQPELYKYYRARVHYKSMQPQNQELPQPAEGQELTVQAAWLMTEGDPYPGEYAFEADGSLMWLPQRDLILLNELPELSKRG